MSKSYNGHPSWTLWNVSLWLANDEGLYRKAKSLMCVWSKDRAAERMLEWLQFMGQHKTPDGASYTKTSIRYAMRDL